jgi:methyl-accepting chemotaxis protein PixJ
MIPTNSKPIQTGSNHRSSGGDRTVDRDTQKAITALSALKLELKHSGLLNKPQVQALFRQIAEFVATRPQPSEPETPELLTIAPQSVEALQTLLATIKASNAAMNRSEVEISSVRISAIESRKKLERLRESCQKAEKALNLMKHCTTQTQLLALNASLDASRAGEYGRSFANVADELRSLTRQLAEGMRDIEKLTQEFQSETVGIGNTMDVEVQQIEACSNLIKQIQQQLMEAVHTTEQVIDNI